MLWNDNLLSMSMSFCLYLPTSRSCVGSAKILRCSKYVACPCPILEPGGESANAVSGLTIDTGLPDDPDPIDAKDPVGKPDEPEGGVNGWIAELPVELLDLLDQLVNALIVLTSERRTPV